MDSSVFAYGKIRMGILSMTVTVRVESQVRCFPERNLTVLVRNLSKIRKHVVIAHRKFSGVKVEAEDESDMKHHDAGEDFQDV
jgi:hypothetical protein